MMYATPNYYQESAVRYGGSMISVKQEPIDHMNRNGSVDMYISDRELRPQINLYVPVGSQILNSNSEKCFDSQAISSQYQPVQHTIQNCMCNLNRVSAENYTVPASTPPLDREHSQTKGDNGKLLVPSVLTKNGRTFSMNTLNLPAVSHQRAKREFVPDCKKDDNYWCRRLKNNDSARRSRVKRKVLEKIMETRLLELQKENFQLKHEVASLRRRFGEEEGSNSDSSSSRDLTFSSSPEDTHKVYDDHQTPVSDDSHSNEDSKMYRGTAVTNHHVAAVARCRTNSIDSSTSSSPVSSIPSSNSRPGSRNSQTGSIDVTLRTDVTGALDLTNDCTSRLTSAWETSSFDSCSFTNSRRSSYTDSESTMQEDASIRRLKTFPLKCRWKKELNTYQ